MARADLILITVNEPHRSALRRWAHERRLSSLELEELEAIGYTADFEPILCVLEVSAESEASPERIRSLRKSLGTCPLVVLARNIGIACAVELVRMGVEDVLEPTNRLTQDLSRVTRHIRREVAGTEIVGSSTAARQLRREIAAASPLGSTVLLRGEAGVGKGAVARAIHERSRFQSHPFVEVDCDSLAPDEVEAELFAPGRRTLFLDEVSDLHNAVQAKLVRKLSGPGDAGAKGTATPPRIIAATSKDLRDELRRGRFRGDLYVRLNVLQIAVPPLRERLTDVPELALHALERIAKQLAVRPPAFSDEVFHAMMRYSWPGNVRELMNLVEQALIRYQGGAFDEEEFVAALDPVAAQLGTQSTRASSDLSRATIASVLAATGGNVSRAARRLGVPRTTLTYRIRVLGLDDRVPKD
jgi:DNA-binding NtrC family response regulator